MRIRNQVWIETDTHLVLTLHKPFWSAWQKYGWIQGVEGLGISLEAMIKANELKKKIRVNVIKYGSYEITVKRALKFSNNRFYPRDKKVLIVIPRDAFDKIVISDFKKRENEEKERERVSRIAELEQRSLDY